jgi:autotransporter-associated beta strand protein
LEKQRSLLSDIARLNRVASSRDVDNDDAKLAWANANKALAQLRSRERGFTPYHPGSKETKPMKKAAQAIQADVERQLEEQSALVAGNAEKVAQLDLNGRKTDAGQALVLPGHGKVSAGTWNLNGVPQAKPGKDKSFQMKEQEESATLLNDNAGVNNAFFNKGEIAITKGGDGTLSLTKSGTGTMTLTGNASTAQKAEFSGGNTVSNNARGNIVSQSQANLALNTDAVFDNTRPSGSAGHVIGTTDSGAVILSGANTYTGTTTVSAGTVIASNTATGNTTIASGGILRGTNTWGGAVTLDNSSGIGGTGDLRGKLSGNATINSLSLNGTGATTTVQDPTAISRGAGAPIAGSGNTLSATGGTTTINAGAALEMQGGLRVSSTLGLSGRIVGDATTNSTSPVVPSVGLIGGAGSVDGPAQGRPSFADGDGRPPLASGGVTFGGSITTYSGGVALGAAGAVQAGAGVPVPAAPAAAGANDLMIVQNNPNGTTQNVGTVVFGDRTASGVVERMEAGRFVDLNGVSTRMPAPTPQLKPVGRVSLAVDVPLTGAVFHFSKIKDHALLEVTVAKPWEPRRKSALWALLGGAVISGAVTWRRRRRQ